MSHVVARGRVHPQSLPHPFPRPFSHCDHFHFLPTTLDVVSPKMFEELKSQLESLSQEVALLKEQQALQTGECRQRPLGLGVHQTEGLWPAASL